MTNINMMSSDFMPPHPPTPPGGSNPALAHSPSPNEEAMFKQAHKPYLRRRSPDSPFEIKLCPGKGLGAFATHDLPKGTLILSETPLIVVNKECPTEDDVENQFAMLRPADKLDFMSLRKNGLPFASKIAALEANNFSWSNTDGSGPCRWALIVAASHFNHSCVPNSIASTTEDFEYTFDGLPMSKELNIYASKPIASGEEITFCYWPDVSALTRAERHAISWGRGGFICSCEACDPTTPFGQTSEMRRRLLGGIKRILFECGRDESLVHAMRVGGNGGPHVHNIADWLEKFDTEDAKWTAGLVFLGAQLLAAEGVLSESTAWLLNVPQFVYVQGDDEGDRIRVSKQMYDNVMMCWDRVIEDMGMLRTENHPEVLALKELRRKALGMLWY